MIIKTVIFITITFIISILSSYLNYRTTLPTTVEDTHSKVRPGFKQKHLTDDTYAKSLGCTLSAR